MTRPARARTAGFSAVEFLVVIAVAGVIAAISLPFTNSALAAVRIKGDATSLSNAVAVAKMRAAADFTQARVYADLAAGTLRVESWRKTAPIGWTADTDTTALSTNVQFGFSAIAAPPPNSQAAIAQAPACRANDNTAIANTACVVFNSRGIPVDTTGAPIGTGALYVTDGSSVYGVTVAATGLLHVWRTFPKDGIGWTAQ